MDQHCPVCGAPYHPGEAFCMNCGSRLPAPAPVPPAPAAGPWKTPNAQTFVPVSQQTAAAPATPVYAAAAYPPQAPAPEYPPAPLEPEDAPKKSHAGLIVALSVIVLLLAAAAALYFFVFTPTSVSLSETSLKIGCGEEVKLSAEISPGIAFLDTDIKWTSSDSDIATVSKSGTVTGVKEGSCEITATTGNGKEATCTVKVKVAPEAMTLSDRAITLEIAKTHTLTATIAPKEAKDAEIEWSSSDPDVATVEDGTVTAVSVGSCEITAATANGIKATCAVTVKPEGVEVEDIKMSDTFPKLKVGETLTLKVAFYPEDATDQTVTWKSTDPKVATVDSNGTVTAVGAGSCEITATAANGVSDTCSVFVGEAVKEVEYISLSTWWVEDLKAGDKFTLTVEIYPNDATDKTVTWTTSDPTVATVKDGTVTAVGPGTCEITATASNGKNAACSVEVTVSAKPAVSAQINVGDYVLFGSYEQDNYSYNGQEDIEWLVLDKQGNSVLLISRFALDCQLFNDSMTNATWDMSSLRSWLNDTFYYSAFSSDERSRILSTTVAASENPTFTTYPGSNTYDKIFLLSISEATWYLGSDALRQCKGTAYCTARGAYVGTGGNCWWWLRTPGNRNGSAANVSSSGVIHYDGNDADSAAGAVRPAMWITIG